MTRRWVLGAVALFGALALIVAWAPGAAAIATGSGELGGGTLRVGVEVDLPGSQPVPVDAESVSLPRLVHYVATPLPVSRLGDIENLCDASGAAVSDPTQIVFGWLYDVVGYTHDGRVVSDTHQCVALPNPDDHSTAPPPPPEPEAPTVGAVWRAVVLPRPIVGANPVSRGVTGLTTRLWSGGAQTALVAVAIDGFTVTGVAHVVEYRFATDEGYLGASANPGGASSPAETHRFATKGAHSLSVSSVWRATVTMTVPGVAVPVLVDLDFAVLTVTVDYPVVEVRSVLVS